MSNYPLVPVHKSVNNLGNVQSPLDSLDFAERDSDPSTREARFYYNTTDKMFKFYNGTSWVALGTGGTSVTSGSGPPVAVPVAVGDQYVDTTNDQNYLATDTAASTDWRIASLGLGTPTLNFSVWRGTLNFGASLADTAQATGTPSAASRSWANISGTALQLTAGLYILGSVCYLASGEAHALASGVVFYNVTPSTHMIDINTFSQTFVDGTLTLGIGTARIVTHLAVTGAGFRTVTTGIIMKNNTGQTITFVSDNNRNFWVVKLG